MKKTIITLTLAFTLSAVNADATESNMPQHIGFGSGAAIGAVLSLIHI